MMYYESEGETFVTTLVNLFPRTQLCPADLYLHIKTALKDLLIIIRLCDSLLTCTFFPLWQ